VWTPLCSTGFGFINALREKYAPWMKGFLIKMENLEQKIKELGKILNSYEMVETGSHEEFAGMGSGDGHSFDDRPEYHTIIDYKKVYNFSKIERKNALSQLKILRKQNNDDNIQKLIDNELFSIKQARKERVQGAFGCLISSIVVLGIGLGIGSCINRSYEKARIEREKEIPHPVYVVQDAYFRARYLEHLEIDKKFHLDPKYNEQEFKKYDEKIKKYGEIIREKLEKGYLPRTHRYYLDYKKIYGNESWWPKDK
jgi:hypothetical protein